jgi:hypothetical protein
MTCAAGTDGAPVTVQLAAASAVFSGCEFDGCNVVVAGGSVAQFMRCHFRHADVAVCVVGTGSSATLQQCTIAACGEGFSVTSDAALRADACSLVDCRAVGMHAASGGTLQLQRCVLAGAAGSGVSVAGRGSDAILQDTDVYACRLRPLSVADGACMRLVGVCKLHDERQEEEHA